MPKFMEVRVVSLRELFSGDYHFRLPWFQRAYAWEKSEVGQLLTHLLDAVQKKKPHYLLGTLFLAKKANSPVTEIVDGHQRTMTLTIMFSVLRDMESSAETMAMLQGLIAAPEYRFDPQENCLDVCRAYVQARGATRIEYDDDHETLSANELSILQNRDHLKELLTKRGIDAANRRALAGYLADECFVALHIFEDAHEAFRSMEIEEETRHDFSRTDRAKASLTSIMPAADRVAAGAIWEQCADMLGGEELYALLGHVRMLKRRKFSDESVETDIPQIFKLNKGGLGFMQSELLPAAERLDAIQEGKIGKGYARLEIAACIERASWIDGHFWIPAALHWLAMRGEDGDTPLFFRRIERFVWLTRIAAIEAPKKLDRVFKLLDEIDTGVKVDEMKSLQIDRDLQQSAIASLTSPTFDRKRYAKAALHRISIVLGSDPGPPCPVKQTIEHILPQGQRGNSVWAKVFPGKTVKSSAHQLGNLTILPRAINIKLANLPWLEKRPVYAQSEFVLTRELKELEAWDATAISNRTDRLIRVLFKAWDLEV